MGACQQEMRAWGQAEHSGKWEVVVQWIKGFEGSTVSSGKRKKIVVAEVKCVLNTGAGDKVKRRIWLELKELFCYTKEFWISCCTQWQIYRCF